MLKKILVMIVFAVLATTVFAGNLETNYFYNEQGVPVDNVQMLIFKCENNFKSCYEVEKPSFYNQNSGGDNFLSHIEYPTSTEHIFYASYLYSPGYLPKSYSIENWGDGEHYYYDVTFNKGHNCQSPIDSFSMTNTIYANEPIVINVDVSVDARAQSAFYTVNRAPFYVPDNGDFVGVRTNYYSSLTRVTFEVTSQNGNIVYSDFKDVNIYMDSSSEVEFSWTPLVAGENYSARVYTEVIDDQCDSTVRSESVKTFNVLSRRPSNEYYLLLNNLELENIGQIYEDDSYLDFSYDKTCLEVDDSTPNRNYRPLGFNAIYRIFNKTGSLKLESFENVLDLSINAVQIESRYDISTLDSGKYTLEVTGVPYGYTSQYTAANIDTISVDFEVHSLPKYDIMFNVLDSVTGLPVVGATLSSAGQSVTTDGTGFAVISDVNDGTYNYEITDSDYFTATGSISVNGDDESKVVYMIPIIGNTQCSDGLDNDGDGFVDMSDPDCSSPQDNTEDVWTPGNTQCSDGLDNDGDGFVDLDDVDCANDPINGQEGYYNTLWNKPELVKREYLKITNFPIGLGDLNINNDEFLDLDLTFKNEGSFEIKDVVVTISIPELGTWYKTSPKDIDPGESISEQLYLDIYDVEPGFYNLRLSLTGQGQRQGMNGYSRARWYEVYIE